ncbi:catalase [Pseudoxanthomonas suwonensis]|uniref:catalase n=1 Tax=Pseudoxanthomonas suwonensis TaxID=314722 RepID=UPI00130E6EB2|nr:catalase [Pseudoxanthomonas suwonensis]
MESIHRNFGGFYPGCRGVHANGRYYAATFVGSPAAPRISRALHLQGDATPATVRFSNSPSGNPMGPARSVSMATKFFLPDGTVTDLVALPLAVFITRTPEETLAFLEVAGPDPGTGIRDEVRIQAFVAARPWIGHALQLLQAAPAALSFARTRFNALHAFRFVNADGNACHARYSWEPEAGEAGQTLEALHQHPPSHLYEELEARLRDGPVGYRLALQIAGPEDPTHDPTAAWPADRQRVIIGRLELTRPTSPEEIGDPVMLHDPTRLTDGIEMSDDPILAARRGIYELSAAHRTGGWKGRSAALARAGGMGCPFTALAST